MRRASILLVAALAALPAPALSEENGANDGAKRFTSDVKEMGKQVGRAAKKVGKDIGQGTARAARTVKREFKEDFVRKKDDDGKVRKQEVERTGRR